MKIINLVFGLMILGGCSGNIPEAYQGKYQDRSTGARLELSSNSGTFTTPLGRELSDTVEDPETVENQKAQFEKILRGETGIFLRSSSTNSNLVKIFWISPDVKSRGEDSKYVWYDKAEILFMKLDLRQKDKVTQFKVIHSESGSVYLNLADKPKWSAGWGLNPIEYEMVRYE